MVYGFVAMEVEAASKGNRAVIAVSVTQESASKVADGVTLHVKSANTSRPCASRNCRTRSWSCSSIQDSCEARITPSVHCARQRSKTETKGRLSAGDPVKIDHAAPNVRFGQPLELPSQGRLRCRMANGFVGNKVVTSKRLSYTGVHRDRCSEPDY